MRQIAKWTFLCLVCTMLGFGATVLVANGDRVLQTLVAMLPAPANAADVLEMDVADIAPAVEAVAEEPAPDLAAADLPQADAPAQVELAAVGAFAASGAPAMAADPQLAPGVLSAVGTIGVVRDRAVIFGASARVDRIEVEVGDVVQAGDVLIGLDTTYLDWDVEQAELSFETARIDFEEAGTLVDESDVAVAEANLLLAQERLAEVEAGPKPEELAAAEATALAAWARLAEVQARPTPNQMILAQVDLKRAEIAVQAAQREYDRIAWLPESAATSAADSLQGATIAYEAALVTFEEASKPATEAEIQSAYSAAQSAQASLNALRLRPTPAELASARASLATAEAALEELQKGPEMAAVRKAELGVRQAMINLDAARLARDSAEVLAPIDGTVLEVNAELGQQVGQGSVAARIANTADTKLTVNVEQRDISRIQIGQAAVISIYALPNDRFTGVVEQIAPLADAGTGFVTFPVIIRFNEGPVDKILPGMTASAAFIEEGATESADPAAVEATPTPTPAAEAPTDPAVVATATPLPEAEATATPSN